MNIFWQMLGHVLLRLLGEKAHAQIIIVVKDGVIQPVHINRTYAPGDLPKV